jgi:hypothetical protein
MCVHAKQYHNQHMNKAVPVCTKNKKYCVKVNFIATKDIYTYELLNTFCEMEPVTST